MRSLKNNNLYKKKPPINAFSQLKNKTQIIKTLYYLINLSAKNQLLININAIIKTAKN